MRTRAEFHRAVRIGTTTLASFCIAVIVWFLTPLPTLVAQFFWLEFHSGPFALALDRGDANLAANIGMYYFGNQRMIGSGQHPYDIAFAERALEKAIAINPTLQGAHYTLGRIEFVNSEFDAALANLSFELTLYPENKRPLYIRGLVYAYRGKEGDLALAADDFQAFVTWSPLEWAGYNDLAYVLAKEKQYAKARDVLKDGIIHADAGAGNPWLWNTLGVMQMNLHESKAAVVSFQQAQTFAATLTDIDWQRAYPGNDPTTAAGGLASFKNGILENLAGAYSAYGK